MSMTNLKPKLELTWLGKENRPRLEFRILLPGLERSFCVPPRVAAQDIFDHNPIHGDNVLALEALQEELGDRTKCIHIGPPYNTRKAFKHS